MANHQRDSRKEDYWRRHLQSWSRSALSVRDYCARHQLSEASFYAWRRLLAERDRETLVAPRLEPTPPLFVPLHLPVAPAPLELLLPDGLVVRVPGGFDADTLRRLVETLRGPAC